MILFPAIDLKDGACVRLERGDMARATLFNQDPAAQARVFAAAGAAWIHVVDLDGAVAGRSRNGPAVHAIRAATRLKLQLGGGIRDMAGIEAWLGAGIDRVVLGTAALRNPALVRAACARFPGQIAAGIDARGGKVAVQGWTETSEVAAPELAARMEAAGVAAIIFTDIDRDGVLGGPNFAATASLAAAVTCPVIASGGVASIDDLKRLAAAPKIAGAIVGRALYDGRIDLGRALASLRGVGADA
jgi:phosphoribosylformimino-5-aminoimidazole carboxamide ribotide isomerase